MKKTLVALFLIVTFLVAVFLWTAVSPIWAQGDPGILWKLNSVLENQNKIVNLLNEIKSDLKELKFRR